MYCHFCHVLNWIWNRFNSKLQQWVTPERVAYSVVVIWLFQSVESIWKWLFHFHISMWTLTYQSLFEYQNMQEHWSWLDLVDLIVELTVSNNWYNLTEVINSSGPSNTHMQQWTGSTLVLVMVISTGPLSNPILVYHKWIPLNAYLMIIQSKIKIFTLKKLLFKLPSVLLLVSRPRDSWVNLWFNLAYVGSLEQLCFIIIIYDIRNRVLLSDKCR